MSAFHVAVRTPSRDAPNAALAPLAGLLDVVVEGVNITARIGEAQAITALVELGHAVDALAHGRRDRATVQLYAAHEAWELGLETDGADVLLSVYRCGPCPEVVAFEQRVPLEALRSGLLEALGQPLTGRAPRGLGATLESTRRLLATAPPARTRLSRERVEHALAPRPVQEFAYSATLSLRTFRGDAVPHDTEDSRIERADLHSLLGEGPVLIGSRGRRAALGSVQVFLLVEQLLALSEEVTEAWELGRPLFRRVAFGAVRLGVRRGPGDGPLAFTVGSPHVRTERSSVTFPELDPEAFVLATTRFARGLADAILRHDPRQRSNLRLEALRRNARALEQRIAAAHLDTALTNPAPESYRSFAPPRAPQTTGRWDHGGKMRFVARWVATVPGIDLRATFLCGDRFIIGAERETACITSHGGEIVWRQPTQRAAAVVTPAGLVRVHADGRTTLHELDTGAVRFSVQLDPRAAGCSTGAVVHTPGLPKLLVVPEGDRRLTALDLVSGDVRWRYTARRRSQFRLRRAGKLLVVTGGDTTLVALDVVTGDVVWRARGRIPFGGEVAVDHDALYALTGGRGAPSELVHLDPWSGAVRWTVPLEDRFASGQDPLLTPSAVVVPSRDRRGVGARGFERATGQQLWTQEPGIASPTTAWLAVDDAIVANSAAGALLCLEAQTGRIRFHHVFSRHVDADQPRRLEPVLRSGALFVPQHQIHVVRPRDGEVLGVVPSDLIPDLVRVDERCGVFVVEESGHVAAFSAAPRLTLVK
ncbi:MAG: PQQ-like beta-propeller repeat protein [Polyangiaceae bacterium]|nr:PQQ-like beta-propeller repeat protein [Polyangiaceae bacterium]